MKRVKVLENISTVLMIVMLLSYYKIIDLEFFKYYIGLLAFGTGFVAAIFKKGIFSKIWAVMCFVLFLKFLERILVR